MVACEEYRGVKEAALVVTESVRAVVKKRERKKKEEFQNRASLIKQCSVSSPCVLYVNVKLAGEKVEAEIQTVDDTLLSEMLFLLFSHRLK